MKVIGIYTKNFSLYHDLLKVLKRRKIPYVSLSSISDIPNRIKVILTSHSELHDFKSEKVLAADVYENIDQVIDIALQIIFGKELYSNVFIGIDPGEKPGIAVVGDDILLQKTHVKSPDEILKIIKRFLKEYPAIDCLIRIGDGSMIIRNRIINSLIPLGIPIEIVDESKTSSLQQTKRAERDSEAAASIALLKGGKVQKHQPLKPTRGDMKKVQERSRYITEGKFSISEKTALCVLKGNISLIEAIEKEKNHKKPKRL
jgi:hypothetical protein